MIKIANVVAILAIPLIVSIHTYTGSLKPFNLEYLTLS